MTEEQKSYLASEEYVEGAKCLELEVPWMVPEAIYKIEENLRPTDGVLECGCGGSTLFFAKRCRYVNFVESNLDWMHHVMSKLLHEKLYNNFYGYAETSDAIAKHIRKLKTEINVFSVDTQGGIDRSEILNAFLENGVPPCLRMIILDNYAHEGLFPLHYYRWLDLGENWEVFTYDHPRWAGEGTKIYLKK